MSTLRRCIAAAIALLLTTTVEAQAASGAVTSNALPTPSVAPGYKAQVVARDLETPRGIIHDSTDRLLTVQRGVGVVGIIFKENNGNVSVGSSNTIVDNGNVRLVQLMLQRGVLTHPS